MTTADHHHHHGSRLLTTSTADAVAALQSGALVAIPTETVYGLAANAADRSAIERIFAVKRRPPDHPLILHGVDLEGFDGWVRTIPAEADRLAAACWPGGLTLLLSRGPRTSDAITGGRDTVAVRVPAHDLTLAVLRDLATPVAAPSANRFGHVSPTTAGHVIDDLGDVLDPLRDRVLDGGPCAVGVESTIVDLTSDPPQILRAGAVPNHTIAELLGHVPAPPRGPSRASGMLASHYAPRCQIELVSTASELESRRAALAAAGARVATLDRTSNPTEAAHRLYDDLRSADRAAVDVLVVRVPEAGGIGDALRDRLSKAAATHGGRWIDEQRPLR